MQIKFRFLSQIENHINQASKRMKFWNQWIILFICVASGYTNKPPSLTSCDTLGSTTKPSTLSSCLLYYVLEKQPIGTSVIRFEATDPENDTVLFTLVGDNTAGYIFNLVSDGVRSTKLVVNALIDLKFIASTVILTLSMNDQHGNDGILSFITILIAEINDEAPIFQNLPYICNIKENTNASNCAISELDYTENPYIRFSLSIIATQASKTIKVSDYFVLTQSVQILPKPRNGYIWTTNVSNIKPLDYEVLNIYELLVTATNGGGLNSSIDVIVNVIDEPDNPPIFVNITCGISVMENSPYGTNVTVIQAIDGDRGINNPIKYTLINGSFSQYFIIDENTGLLQCSSQSIDREAPNIINSSGVINLTVKATEICNDTSPAISLLQLSITVIDANDNKPTFKNLINNTYQATVMENSPVGTAISMQPLIKVEDLDQYNNNVFQLTLQQNGQPFSMFNMFPNSSIIASSDCLILVANSSMLDYEQIKQIIFQIVVHETPIKEEFVQSATVVLTLLDANEYAPVFYNFTSEVHVAENASINDVVTTLHAFGNETGIFGVIVYYLIEGNENNTFFLEQMSGRLLLKKSLDREAPGGSSYCLLITAQNMNGSFDARVTSHLLQIIVDDVNDNGPVFLFNQYGQDWSIFEYFSVDIHVGDVQAIDKDVGMNANITYSLNNIASQSNRTTDLFRVETQYDALIGVYKAAFYTRISLRNSFDSKLGNCFNATLTASDRGTPSKSTDVLVTFCIILINNPPLFVQPLLLNNNQSLKLSQVGLNDTSQINTTIYTFKAVDMVLNEQIFYDINGTNFFTVNQLSGALSIAKMLNRYIQEQHVFSVLAYAMANNARIRLTASVKVVVTVLDADEPSFPIQYHVQNVSLFQNTPLNVTLPNGQKGAFIQSVGRAGSSNVGNFSQICYFILNKIATTNFYLVKESGDLYRTELLVSSKSYTIYVKAVSYQFCNDDTYLWKPSNQSGRRRLLYLDDAPVTFNASDPSMSQVTIAVNDPPRFVTVQGVKDKMFYIGITTDTKPMVQIFDFSKYTINVESSVHQFATYGMQLPMVINSDLQATLAQRRLTQEDLFNLNNFTGVLTLGNKVYFQDQMQGYFSFFVSVTDGISVDKANTTISLLNINQQVMVTFYKNVTLIYPKLSNFTAFLSNRTGWQIVADSLDVHKRDDGTADLSMSDLYLHALDLQTYNIVPASLLMQALDKEWQSLQTLYDFYFVDQVKLASAPILVESAALFQYRTSLVAVTCVFVIIFIVNIIIIWTCRRMYRVKLKAATAVAFGPGAHGSLSHLAMPGTNQYTFEGSNPIWTGEYGNTAYATSSEVNQSDKDSLDENVVDSKKATVDDQERCIEFYADSDTTSLTHVSTSKLTTSDYILSAAIRDHDREKQV